MTATDRLKCTGCDRFVRPQRALFGYTLCNACLTQTGTACPCTRCGRNTHVLPGAEVPLCFRCERTTWFERQTCKRCGRSLAERARKRHPDGTASCASCTAMLADPVACHYCGRWGLKRSRDYQRGVTERDIKLIVENDTSQVGSVGKCVSGSRHQRWKQKREAHSG